MAIKIGPQLAYEAYRKLKNYFYFDNTSLFIRKQIAEFEHDFYGEKDVPGVKKIMESKLNGVLKVINDNDDELLDKYLKKIDFKYYTKNVEANKNPDDSLIINRPLSDDIIVNHLNLIIDAPIEIHILSVLWLMVVGVHFRKSIKKNNYAYQFMLNDDDDNDSNNNEHGNLQLYRPYYIGYQKWRDTALSTALRILDEKKDATILSLDIKRFYYSVRVNLFDLLSTIKKDDRIDVDLDNFTIKRLTNIVHKINRIYTEKILDYVDKDIRKDGLDDVNVTLLPVGLLSSGFIANLVLCKFDNEVVKKMNPAYYGRYVDDLLFVFSDRKIQKDEPLSNFVDENFVRRELLVPGDEQNKEYYLKSNPTLFIQKSKIILEHFYHNESRAAINNFKNTIDRQRSEFRFLPDEDVIGREFDNEAFVIQYSDSVRKLRSIKEFKADKYGASKFLAHKIFLACLLNHSEAVKDKKEQDKSNQQILTFFKGANCIELSSLWEKVATYYIINNDDKYLQKFYKQTSETIKKIKSKELTENQIRRYQTDLLEYLMLSIATPWALNLKFEIKAFGDNSQRYNEVAKDIRFSNMFRHNITGISGINYTKSLYKDDVNLYNYSAHIDNFDDVFSVYLSPRFVHYDELNVVAINRWLSSKQANGIDIDREISGEAEAFFNKVNKGWYAWFEVRSSPDNRLFEINPASSEETMVTYIKICEDEVKSCNKRVGIVNMKVSSQNISKSMWGKPILTSERRNELFDIVNTAIKEKCEILVLPELSVPFQWLETLVNQCKRHDIAIIAGLEYFHGLDNNAYNCVATILPIKTKYYTTAKVTLRVKNYYAPKEEKDLMGRRKNVPNVKKGYHLFHWRGCYFSVYNCFELANISDRALLKSKVDFIVATEWNPDINYYSEIAGSWVRDVHCYFIQCNTSNYGNSCIMKPSKSVESRMVVVKGGQNSTVLVDDLDIEKLRAFQFKEHILQMDDESFKLTPPDFDKGNVEKRLNNEIVK